MSSVNDSFIVPNGVSRSMIANVMRWKIILHDVVKMLVWPRFVAIAGGGKKERNNDRIQDRNP
jgi:hypothetical protein